MKNKLSLTRLCLLMLLIYHTGCMTTTQKGASYGTAGGAALGTGVDALTGNYENQQELKVKRSEESRYSIIKERDGELFERIWENNHWTYTPTNDSAKPNLFLRVKDKNGRWEFIPLNNDNRQDQVIIPQIQHEDFSPPSERSHEGLQLKGNKGIEEATRRIEEAWQRSRNENK